MIVSLDSQKFQVVLSKFNDEMQLIISDKTSRTLSEALEFAKYCVEDCPDVLDIEEIVESFNNNYKTSSGMKQYEITPSDIAYKINISNSSNMEIVYVRI